LSLLKPIHIFFVRIWSALKLLWAFLKRFYTRPPSINVEKATNVLIFSPVITGHIVRDVTLKIEAGDWPKKLESANSIIPSVIEMPRVPSLDRQAFLVYKSIMRSLEKATIVLDPILSQALRLCCTRRAALFAENFELAELVEKKIDRIASLPAPKGYTPPDIRKWYERFCELDDAGDLSGIVIPCLEAVSEKLLSQLGIPQEAQIECTNFVSWLHGRLAAGALSFKREYLNIGVVYVGELPPAVYVEVVVRLLKEEKVNTVILGAYGTQYTTTSAQAASIIDNLKIRNSRLAHIVLAPQFKFGEPGEAPPFLSSYFLINADFAQGAEETADLWMSLASRLTKSAVIVQDEKTGLTKVSDRIAKGKMVLVEHNWQTMRDFFRVCFRTIVNHQAKIVCHKVEIRRDGGAAGGRPSAYVSLVLGPSKVERANPPPNPKPTTVSATSHAK